MGCDAKSIPHAAVLFKIIIWLACGVHFGPPSPRPHSLIKGPTSVAFIRWDARAGIKRVAEERSKRLRALLVVGWME